MRQNLSTAILILALAVSALAQSSGGSFTITSHVVAGGGCGPDGSGGCTSSNGSGSLRIEGTVGEPGAIDLSRQPPFSVGSGFWHTTVSNSPTAANGNVAGRVVDSSGNPVEGAAVRLSGTQTRLTVTDALGNYHFDRVETNGFYTVTPSRPNFDFNPLNRSFSLVGNQIDAAFTGATTGDRANPIDTVEYFVRQQYVDVLGREPDEAGFNYWYDQIQACNLDSACTRAQRTKVAAAFFIEWEAQQTAAFIYSLYQAAFSRTPAFREYTLDHQQVAGGPTLGAQKALFALSFVQRSAFIDRYQGTPSAEGFVDELLRQAQSSGVELSSRRAALIASYQAGQNLADSRAAVLRMMADDATFKKAHYNSAFVLTEYFAYLQRDIDIDGFNFWVGVLANGGPESYPRMVCSFVTSREYQQRFSAVVSHSNAECGQ